MRNKIFILLAIVTASIIAQNSMVLHLSNGTKYSVNTSDVDSITFYSIPTDGLVAYYPFNGNANDESGNGHDGVVNGATLTTDSWSSNGRGDAKWFGKIDEFAIYDRALSVSEINGLFLAGK